MNSFDVAIVGGGSGGLSAAARLARAKPRWKIAVIEPSGNHFYQPGFIFAGLGLGTVDSIKKPMSELIPKTCSWIRDAVTLVKPSENSVQLTNGDLLNYRALLIAPGLITHLDAIPGLNQALSESRTPVCSVFTPSGCVKFRTEFEQFMGGTMVFTMPSGPMKCNAAPLKTVLMVDDLLRRTGRREVTRLLFVTPYRGFFGLQGFEQTIAAAFKRRGIEVLFGHELEKVDNANQVLHLNSADWVERKVNQLKFDFAHITPRMKAPSFIRQSGLHHEEGPHAGFLMTHPLTLQHPNFANIFGTGDVTGLPTLKSSEAALAQAKVATKNILTTLSQQPVTSALQHYNGYTACPIYLGVGVALPCKLQYDGKIISDRPWSPFEPSRLSWIINKHLQPHLYWKVFLRGWRA